MKTIVKAAFIGIVAVLASCSDADRTTYDGSGQTLLQFGNTTYNFTIPKDSSTVLDVEVQASTKKSSDRTYNVVVDDNPENTTADPATYSVPNTVTIPAGEYVGHLLIEGEDIGVETFPKETITLILSNPNEGGNTILEDNITTLTQYQVCPVPEDFLIGDYTLVNVTESLGPSNSTHNLGEGVITIAEGESATERVFTAEVLPSVGAAPVEFTLSLECNNFVLQEAELLIQCNEGIFYGPAPEGQNSTYDPSNEQDSYTINYTEDTTNDCGAKGVASFKLTKVN